MKNINAREHISTFGFWIWYIRCQYNGMDICMVYWNLTHLYCDGIRPNMVLCWKVGGKFWRNPLSPQPHSSTWFLHRLLIFSRLISPDKDGSSLHGLIRKTVQKLFFLPFVNNARFLSADGVGSSIIEVMLMMKFHFFMIILMFVKWTYNHFL